MGSSPIPATTTIILIGPYRALESLNDLRFKSGQKSLTEM